MKKRMYHVYGIALQRKFCLCRFPQPLLYHVAHPGDELAVGGFAFFGTDGIAEVTVQYLPVPSGPGDFNQVADGPQKIAFIGILVA